MYESENGAIRHKFDNSVNVSLDFLILSAIIEPGFFVLIIHLLCSLGGFFFAYVCPGFRCAETRGYTKRMY